MKMHPYVFELQSHKKAQVLPHKMKRSGQFYIGVSEKKDISTISLNRVAGEIFELCNNERTLTDIVKEMKVIYPDVNEETLSLDVLTCVRNLESKGLVKLD